MTCWKDSGYGLLQQKDAEQNLLWERHMGQIPEKTGHGLPQVLPQWSDTGCA